MRDLLASASNLQWSTQPIYVLDKDNDLDVTALALANAADIVRVQPEGPYLVGGHSYGGTGAGSVGGALVEQACTMLSSSPPSVSGAHGAPSHLLTLGLACLPARHPVPTVAMQIAMVLESWGKEVGLVLVMDTPRPDQVR